MAATYEPIYTTTLASTQSSLTFNSFGGYTDLIVVGNPILSGSLDYKWYVNGDNSSGLYSQTRLTGDGSSATSSRTPNASSLYLNAATPASGSTQAFIMQFQNYTNTSVYKTALIRYSGAGSDVSARVALWRNTNAITSLTISTDSSTFAIGSTFTLYGIKAA